MKLPANITVNIYWDRDTDTPWMTVGELAEVLSLASPDAPVYVVMDEYGNFDRLQIGDPHNIARPKAVR